MTSVSAGHIILTPTQPVGSGPSEMPKIIFLTTEDEEEEEEEEEEKGGNEEVVIK